MRNHKIYRLENDQGEGPFTSYDDVVYDDNRFSGDTCDAHKTPDEQFHLVKNKTNNELIFAFKTMQDFLNVFSCAEGRAALFEHTLTRLYEITDAEIVWEDDIQCAFIQGTGMKKLVELEG